MTENPIPGEVEVRAARSEYRHTPVCRQTGQMPTRPRSLGSPVEFQFEEIRYTFAVMPALPKFQPMRLARRKAAFDHPDWVFQLKHDGFRALAYVEDGRCRLVSRRRHEYRNFRELCSPIVKGLRVKNAVLDGEIVSLAFMRDLWLDPLQALRQRAD